MINFVEADTQTNKKYTAGRATRPEWICSQGFYFESRAGGRGEVRIFGEIG